MLDELRSSQQIHRFDKGYSQYQNGLAPSMPEAHAVRRVLRFVRERERERDTRGEVEGRLGQDQTHSDLLLDGIFVCL